MEHSVCASFEWLLLTGRLSRHSVLGSNREGYRPASHVMKREVKARVFNTCLSSFAGRRYDWRGEAAVVGGLMGSASSGAGHGKGLIDGSPEICKSCTIQVALCPYRLVCLVATARPFLVPGPPTPMGHGWREPFRGLSQDRIYETRCCEAFPKSAPL